MGIKAVGFCGIYGHTGHIYGNRIFLEGLVKLSHLTSEPLTRHRFGIIRTAILIAPVSTVISPFLMAWQWKLAREEYQRILYTYEYEVNGFYNTCCGKIDLFTFKRLIFKGEKKNESKCGCERQGLS